MKQFIVSMILVVVYLAVCSCHRPAPRLQTKIRKFICEEIASIKEENEKITSALEKEIDELRLQYSLAESKITVLEEEVNELKILEEEVNELKIQSDKAESKITVLEEEVDELKILEDEVDELKILEEEVNELKILEEEVNELKILEEEVNELKILEEEVNELKILEEEVNELKILEEEVNELKIQSDKAGYKSAFAIYGREPIGNESEILRVPPYGVITNEGGDYNSATGVYTAPYTGLYGFVLSIYKESGENDGVTCTMYRNDGDGGLPFGVAFAEVIDASGYRGGSGATLLQLDEGETVHVQCSNVYKLDGRTSYMGFLLKAY